MRDLQKEIESLRIICSIWATLFALSLIFIAGYIGFNEGKNTIPSVNVEQISYDLGYEEGYVAGLEGKHYTEKENPFE